MKLPIYSFSIIVNILGIFCHLHIKKKHFFHFFQKSYFTKNLKISVYSRHISTMNKSFSKFINFALIL